MSKSDNKDLIKKSQAIFKEMGIDLKTTQMYEFLAKLHGEKNWNIAKNKDINFSETLELISQKFSTGNSILDDALYYCGFRRCSSNIILGVTNSGKTNLVCSMGVSALKECNSYGINYNHKVLHISLESDTMNSKYLSLLSGIDINKIHYKNLSDTETNTLQEVHNEYNSRYKIVQNPNWNYTIDSLKDFIDDLYKTFKFDILIIDSPQILTRSEIFVEDRRNLSDLYRKITNLGNDYNCAIITTYNLPRDIKKEYDIKEYMFRHNSEMVRCCHSMIYVETQDDGCIKINNFKGAYPQKSELILKPNKLPYDYSDKYNT